MVGFAHIFWATLTAPVWGVIKIFQKVFKASNKTSKMMIFSALDLLNIFGFSVGSLAITAAVFYGFFANIQEKTWKQNSKLSQQIFYICEKVNEQRKIIKELEEEISPKYQGYSVIIGHFDITTPEDCYPYAVVQQEKHLVIPILVDYNVQKINKQYNQELWDSKATLYIDKLSQLPNLLEFDISVFNFCKYAEGGVFPKKTIPTKIESVVLSPIFKDKCRELVDFFNFLKKNKCVITATDV